MGEESSNFSAGNVTSQFIVSLDFELLWGVRDHANRESYGKNVLGAREAVRRILELFDENDIQATWATVGFLFCESKDELLFSLPEMRPTYRKEMLSNYRYIDEVGRHESADPYYFAPSLIKAISDAPGQEIATHTMSHFYCLEAGASLESFAADLEAARKIAERRGITLKSIVFPRNQYAQAHLEVCSAQGITHYRGNQTAWAYRPTKGSEQTAARRALRLVDAYTGVLGPQDFRSASSRPTNVPASRFLRPRTGWLARFHPRHVATVKHGMTQAARRGSSYHLWWHPHNFGVNLEENMDALQMILEHFRHLHEVHGMASVTMSDASVTS